MNLASAFISSAEEHRSKTAVFYGDDTFTYGAIHAQSQWLAQKLLKEFNVLPGDRVALWLKNCPEFIPALFAIFQAGAVAVPINNFLKPDEVNYILSDAGIKVLITDRNQSEALPKISAAQPQIQFIYAEDMAKSPKEPTSLFMPVGRIDSDLAVIIYTSGTTGRPKGAMLTHGNLLHNVNSCRQVLSAVEADRFALILPMFHSFMLCVCIVLPLLIGGSIVLVKSLHPPKNLLMEIIRHQATILPAIPQLFRALAAAPVSPRDLPLRVCISGAAPLPGEILREWNAKMEGIPLLEGYGLSEASPVVSMNPLAGPWKAGSIGIPIPDVEVTIQDDAGKMLPTGEVGEICVRGGNVMQGYWNQPEETAKSIRDGWLLTGDIGYRDADGYFYITDRKKDMLLVNGINVYPREIEETLYRYPGIKEAAVVGQPDPRKGEQPVAFVALNEGVAAEEKAVVEFLREKLADYKVPRRVIFMPALPRNATGKILKTALREQLKTQA